MKIRNVVRVYTNKADKDTSAKGEMQPNNAQIKPEASVQDITSNYNQAFIKKPSTAKKTTIRVIKKISDAEFKRRLSVLRRKVDYYLADCINKNNISLAEILYTDKELDFPSYEIESILEHTTKDNLPLAERLCTDKGLHFWPYSISQILRLTTKDNLPLAEQLCTDKELDFPRNRIEDILWHTKKDNLSLAQKLCTDKELNFPKDRIAGILEFTNKDNLPLAERLCTDKKLDFQIYKIESILEDTTKDNLPLAQRLCTDKELDFPQDEINYILKYTTKDNLPLAERLCTDKELDFPKNLIGGLYGILRCTTKDNLPLALKLCTDKELDFPKKNIAETLAYTTKDNLPLAEKLFTDKDLEFLRDIATIILRYTNKDNLPLALKLCTDRELDFPPNNISPIISSTNKDNLSLAEQLCTDKELDFPKDRIAGILDFTNKDNLSLAQRLCLDKELDFPIARIFSIIRFTNKDNLPLAEQLCTDKELNFPIDGISGILDRVNKDNIDKALSYVKQVKQGELSINALNEILRNHISISESRKLIRTIGLDKASALSGSDFIIAAKLVPLYNKHNINEIPISQKRNIVRKLVDCNADLFKISDKLKQDFPLIPQNQQEYCSFLPSLVKSLGIETNPLSQAQTENVYSALQNLSSSLASVSDKDFEALSISQEYPKSDFIKDTFNILKDLSHHERQKVYDYFGFELCRNKYGTQVDDKIYHSFSITGYPVNLNNGKKLSQITDPVTKQAVETLRPFVIKFSENNPVSCSIDKLNNSVNTLIDAFPELRPMIGRTQHTTHDFDSFKHSLKVMQKIVQNPQFQNLNNSDKNIMLLASLLHDINKREGSIDHTHQDESAFDAFFISNKLNLSHDQKIKLFSLIKHHEWLAFVNNSKLSDEQKLKNQKSVAFDLQYDNLFNLANIFSQADLKSVKADDSFFNHFNSDLVSHTDKINSLIAELKTTQPLLPVTPFPKASTINNAVTSVYDDGATNIKGVYKDKSGLIILKFNEIQEWEKIGFPKGSVSEGILATGVKNTRGGTKKFDVGTGNIKFFAHGLDYEDQLAKFDVFALPDSDALLSVSYAERPESKYRFFRTQGVVLNTDAKYVHGGGNTDSGSGTKKTVQNFKDDYAFDGDRHSDRTYIANLIKNALNLSDEQYVDFVLRNANKPMSEIEPEEDRNKIIKVLATINSNTRRGDREYNEMYISNPQVMAVFAYSPENNVGDVMSFVHNQEKFLKDYALNNDLPFVVLGD